VQGDALRPELLGRLFILVAPPEISLIDIYRSFGPFICLQLLLLMLVLFFPWLATALL
jgi:TRAP-type mannitol/chloroaromatic compound transport system permease large subunit